MFSEIKNRLPGFVFESILDLGAGPGSASWAAIESFDELKSLYLIEREKDVIDLGKQLATSSFRCFKEIFWDHSSLTSPFAIPSASLAVFSYVLGEMEIEEAWQIVKRVWDSSIPLLTLIEPGTVRGYQRILAIRNRLIAQGARIIAPCPHLLPCPLKENDWCHFAARVERTSLHRRLKKGTLGYEDEKYSYVVFAKPEIQTSAIDGRIIRRPLKAGGYVKFQLCAQDGQIRETTVTRSDKNNYRHARDAEWGSSLHLDII